MLQAIELASFETLRNFGAVHGEAEASSDAELQKYLDHGLLRVVSDEGDTVVGYCGGYVAGNWLHIAEMDVHPAWQRRGFGRRLMKSMIDEAQARRLKGATLTTDRLAPFNAPFYASLGFVLVEKTECDQRLQDILSQEAGKGLDPARRIAMVLEFAS